jgi:hypothetical protein
MNYCGILQKESGILNRIYAGNLHEEKSIYIFTYDLCNDGIRNSNYKVWLLNNETAFTAPELLPAAPNRMHGY